MEKSGQIKSKFSAFETEKSIQTRGHLRYQFLHILKACKSELDCQFQSPQWF